ncbi:MAG: DUF6171 family protein [Clostridiales bacterium]|nr:DUF6171 family protein [Clostridiales bacterium]
MEGRICKKCLLLEAGEEASYRGVADYLAGLDPQKKVADGEYRRRLEICRACDFLIAGMCLKCGCYVEIRAALKGSDCPDYGNRKW